MMGTLAGVLAAKQIRTPEENFWADVQGDIEDVEGVLKISRIKVDYHLIVPRGKEEDAKEAMQFYLSKCPAAQSVIGCIKIEDNVVIETAE